MNIQCTYKGEVVNVVAVEMNGSDIYVTYVYGGKLYVAKDFYPLGAASYTIATSASIV